MAKRQMRQQRQPEPERRLADYTDAELEAGIAESLAAAQPAATAAWPAIKRAGELIGERTKRKATT